MNIEEGKAFVREVTMELFDKGNLEVADKAFAQDYIGHDPASPQPIRGPEGVKRDISMYRKAFPDLHCAIEDVIGEGDRIVTRFKMTGTHKGELMGIPPTGRRAEVTGISISRLSGDKIVEDWTNWDAMGLMQQLGVSPEQGYSGS